ncbi:hypothetical protein, partial [Novipirellula artificiosorum]|uniref:hypothetical protein n=1 Tax=Novipirellula artificiosorum TaxID=2528016 RepID=UPI001E36075A
MYLGLHVLRYDPMTQLLYDERTKILGPIYPKAKGRSLAGSPRFPPNLVRDLRKTTLKRSSQLAQADATAASCASTLHGKQGCFYSRWCHQGNLVVDRPTAGLPFDLQ